MHPFKSRGPQVVAALLVAMVLLLDAMAACPALHELIHKDADCAGHECAVTMFAHGQVDSVVIEVAPVTLATPVETTRQFTFSIFSPFIEQLPSGRAPPVSSFNS